MISDPIRSEIDAEIAKFPQARGALLRAMHLVQGEHGYVSNDCARELAEIFEMRHFENLSIPEISARTARSSDAVRSSLYRVKRMFVEAAIASGQPVDRLRAERR